MSIIVGMLTAMPDVVVSGTHVEYTRAAADYPADDGWTLTLYLAGVDRATPVAGTPSGSDHLFVLADAITAELAAGTYQWEERASKAGKSYVHDSGSVVILPNIATAIAGQMQTHEARALAALDVLIEKRLKEDMSQYTIAQRAAVHEDISKLQSMRSAYHAIVESQKRPGKFGQEVVVVMRRAGA